MALGGFTTPYGVNWERYQSGQSGAEIANRRFADEQLEQFRRGTGPSPAAAKMAAELAVGRQAAASAMGGSAAQQMAAVRGMGAANVAALTPTAMERGAEQWGSLDASMASRQVGSEFAQNRANLAAQIRAAGIRQEAADANRWRSTLSQIGGGLGAGAATMLAAGVLSDERAKRDLAPADREADALLDALRPVRFAYRGEAATTPAHLGVVAQDVERGGPLGRAVVGRDDEGMRFLRGDTGLGAIMAMVGRLEERLGAVESRKGGR